MTTITLQNPADLLVAAKDSEAYGEMIENAKGNCGPILQTIDWAIKKITDWSLIEMIMKPVAGDFNGVDEMKSNWYNAGLALKCVGTNYTTIAGAVDDAWVAPAANKARHTLLEHASAHTRQGTACALMSRQLGNMLQATSQVVSSVCSLLGLVEEWVLTLSVAKLAKEILTGGSGVRRAIRLVGDAIDLIKSLSKLIPALAAACAAMEGVLTALTMSFNLMAAKAQSDAGGHVDDTAGAGF